MADLGLQRILAQGVLLVNWLFETPIPETVQALIAAEPAAQYMAERSLKIYLVRKPLKTQEGIWAGSLESGTFFIG